MVKIARLTFNSLLENTYVLSDDTGEAIIVDAGNASDRENQRLSKYLDDNGLKPVMAVNTHGHIDHLVGVNYIKTRYNIPFAIEGKDEFLVSGAAVYGRLYGFELDKSPEIDIDLSEAKSLKFGKSEIEIIKTPGHSPGHISLYSRENKFVITGDTLFRGSIGRTDLPGGDYSVIMKSIIGNLMTLDGDTAVYPGHGEPTSIAHEAGTNPFITEAIEGEVNF